MRRICFAVVIGVLAMAGTTAGASAAREPVTGCSAAYFRDDSRLGPRDLPDTGALGTVLAGYRRAGVLTDEGLLADYWDPAARNGQGGWRYPPLDGYVIGPDYRPVMWTGILGPGTLIDRFGGERGTFLAPDEEAYALRAIPPSNLDDALAPAGCNYHVYEVLRPFMIDSGPIAAWFGQPGGGMQYQLVAGLLPEHPASVSVGWMVDHGYLEPRPA